MAHLTPRISLVQGTLKCLPNLVSGCVYDRDSASMARLLLVQALCSSNPGQQTLLTFCCWLGPVAPHCLLRCCQAEKQLSELVVAKAMAAKVDRPAGVVVIGKTQQPEDVLNSWSANIGKLLGLVEKATQQIQKEAMVHKVQLGTTA